jgi:hypothetical protein
MLQQLARSVQSIEVRHANVHDHHIRLQLFGHFDRLTAIGRLSTHFPAFVFLEKRTQTPAYDFVVVGQQDTKFHGILQV